MICGVSICATSSAEMMRTALWYAAVLLGVLLIGAVLLWLRRRYRAGCCDEIPTEPCFTLHELREMLKAGRISQEEFARLRAKILSAVRAGIAAPADGGCEISHQEDESLSSAPVEHDDEDKAAGPAGGGSESQDSKDEEK